ncbi:protein of unknown function [Nitrosotalea devaniterrae]|uniref:Uncharacterized protein n=1 Tax=Nitrosotalea devaniterrae TaxID=1078905 RepID=A0A128A2S1_9ARCH|nr:protein of unknown function [Candidatus Nitrosotalea devanaterra]
MGGRLKFAKFMFYAIFTVVFMTMSWLSLSEFTSYEQFSSMSLKNANDKAGMSVSGGDNSELILTNKEGHSINLIEKIKNSFFEVFAFELAVSLFTGIHSYAEWKSFRNGSKRTA